MKRRKFIKTAAGVGAATGAGVFGILKYPRGANASGWGQWPSDTTDLMVPEELRVDSVLEIHFNGGITPWETFYTVPEWGMGAGPFRYLHMFEGDPFAPPNTVDPQAAFTECGLDAGGMDYTEEFANDTAGQTISLGPWTAPLRRRPDIANRMRVMCQSHGILAHEGANPVSFTGTFIGSPRLAGIGAHIQRFYQEAPGADQPVPNSYILFPSGAGFSFAAASTATAIGFHPGSSRPLTVTVTQNSQLTQLLARPGLPGAYRAEFDAAVAHYVQDYTNRFRPGGVGKPTRSVERGNFGYANYARTNAEELIDVLTPDLFENQGGESCGPDFFAGADTDMTNMQANVARSLITNPTYPARYVQWIDTGIFPRPEVGHDVHGNHAYYSAVNISHTLEALASIIQDPNEPRDPTLIDLDRTLVVLNMEFGRTPYRQGGELGTGTNHWPYGYVNVMIGGPVRNGGGSPGSSVYGWIQEDGDTTAGVAQEFITCAENRIMVLSAMGIYPFSSQSFAVADVRDTDDEAAAVTRVRDTFWGLDV